MQPQTQKVAVAALSVASNTVLVIAKVSAGMLMGSVAVISEAVHSAIDLLAAVIALFAVRSSGKPADRDHPFGHGKIENLSGAIEAFLIVAAGLWIISDAVKKILHPAPLEALNWGLLVMLISTGMNYGVSALLFKVGKATDSPALQADGWHLRTDVWTSLAVLGALLVIRLGQFLAPSLDLRWVDPVAAIGIALLIIKTGYDLTVHSARDLMDVCLSPEEEAFIRDVIIRHCPPVCGFHRLKTRKSGPERFIEFHMLVDPKMSVEASHRITVETTKIIRERFPHASVTIHIEPCDGSCSEVCRQGCLLPAEQQRWQSR